MEELDGNTRFVLSSSPKMSDPLLARRCRKMSFCWRNLVSRSVTCACSQDQRDAMELLSVHHFQLERLRLIKRIIIKSRAKVSRPVNTYIALCLLLTSGGVGRVDDEVDASGTV